MDGSSSRRRVPVPRKGVSRPAAPPGQQEEHCHAQGALVHCATRSRGFASPRLSAGSPVGRTARSLVSTHRARAPASGAMRKQRGKRGLVCCASRLCFRESRIVASLDEWASPQLVSCEYGSTPKVLAATDNDRCAASSRSAKAGTSASAGLLSRRVLWRDHGAGDAVRLGFDERHSSSVGPPAVTRRVSDLGY